MQRSLAKNLCHHLVRHQRRVPTPQNPCDVFINHRGIDTKKNVAGLIYDDLIRMKLRPFLDNKSMKPGDKLFDKIDSAIMNCKLGIAVFSPRYCESYFCLHELSLIMESKKRVIPIFVDVKPSELRVTNGVCPPREVERFSWALQEAKYTVGLTFDTVHGYAMIVFPVNYMYLCSLMFGLTDHEIYRVYRDWSEFVKNASDAVIKNLLELEREWPVQNGKTSRMLWDFGDRPWRSWHNNIKYGTLCMMAWIRTKRL